MIVRRFVKIIVVEINVFLSFIEKMVGCLQLEIVVLNGL